MKTSMQLATYLVASIIHAVQSIEFSRVNFRMSSGDIILDLSDRESDLILHIDSQYYDPKKPLIHQGFVRFKDEEFALTRKEIKSINLSEKILLELENYFNEEVSAGAKTEEV